MNRIMLIPVVFILLSCVGELDQKIPLTVKEKLFYEKLKQEHYPPIDSITRVIKKKIYDDRAYCAYVDVYTYEQDRYKAGGESIMGMQASRIASFIANDLDIGDIKIKYIIIEFLGVGTFGKGSSSYSYQLWFNYEVTDDNKIMKR